MTIPIVFPTLESMYQAFEKFVDLLPEEGTLIVCAEDPGAAALIPHVRKAGRNVISYGVQGDMTINTPLWIQARDVKAERARRVRLYSDHQYGEQNFRVCQSLAAGAGSA